ncbi:hypothetical protein PIB30_041584 [Stylosanthes scabra]|uniref:Uncharacterized protein n=1 Tax=Stylosanthes scabra TaxID=79078 RepID=A0ABU6SGL7_9FABA|nr:hypothetical protein [Stylosanthes scabra]
MEMETCSHVLLRTLRTCTSPLSTIQHTGVSNPSPFTSAATRESLLTTWLCPGCN